MNGSMAQRFCCWDGKTRMSRAIFPRFLHDRSSRRAANPACPHNETCQEYIHTSQRQRFPQPLILVHAPPHQKETRTMNRLENTLCSLLNLPLYCTWVDRSVLPSRVRVSTEPIRFPLGRQRAPCRRLISQVNLNLRAFR